MQHRILTVDDDSEARLAVQAILERQQMLVTLAESAEDGLAALSGAHFDLVEALVAKSNLHRRAIPSEPAAVSSAENGVRGVKSNGATLLLDCG